MNKLTLAAVIVLATSTVWGEGSLEEVIVTAQKREQNLQDVPVSVAAFSGDFLRDAGVPSITGLTSVTPNLNFTVGTGGGGSTVNAFIRGVGEFDFLLTTDPAVGLYVDGVYIPRTFGANMELADVEHIEVLRGPQGTLFGKNSIGGAINIATRKPTADLHYSLELSAGNYDMRAAKGYLQTGIVDDLAMSISFLRRTADGWQKRPGDDAGEKDQFAGRAIFAWTPSDKFESLLSIDNLHQKQTGYPNVMLAFDPTASVIAGAYQTIPGFAPCCTPNSNIDRSNAQGSLSKDNVNNTGVNWTNIFQLSDGISLKSISAYRELGARFGRDGDNSAVDYAGDIHDENNRAISQEFQFNGRQLDDRFNWVAGLYYFKEHTSDDTQLITPGDLYFAVAADPSNPYYGFLNYLDFNIDYRNRQKTENYSAYGHVTFDITKQLTLIGGLRYTQEKKDFDQNAVLRTFGAPLLPAGPTTSKCSSVDAQGSYSCDETWREWSPKAGAEYRIDENFMLYALGSSGFRSGGFNGRPTSPQFVKAYDPEKLKSLEAGFKSQWFDNRLRLNGSIYHNVYEDMQLLLFRGAAVVVENAGKTHIDGAELEWQAVLTDDWDFYGGLGYLENNYKKWSDDQGDHTDRKLPFAPRWTGNLGTAYRIPSSIGLATVRADTNFKSSQFLDAANTERLHVGGYAEINASVNFVPVNSNLEFALVGRNLADRRVLNSGFDPTEFFGFIEGSYNAPRTYYLSATYRY